MIQIKYDSIQALAKEKFLEPPEENISLEHCIKDFNNFKNEKGNYLMGYISSLVKEAEIKHLNSEIYKFHRNQLEEVKYLIAEHKENIAFNHFLRSFPSCLPYRARF